MRRLALIAALAASPAAAQDLVFDISHTLACLDRAGGSRDAQEDCIGRSAEACMNATDMGSSTVGMGGCLDREYRYWDDRLNRSYQRLMAEERAFDAEYGDLPGAASRAEALRAMQRAWIPFRDATCDYERSWWGGGTGGGPATASCLMRMTGEQTLYLEDAGLD